MTEELDETICPLCRKEVDDGFFVDAGSKRTGEYTRRLQAAGTWAVAHYLAHLVQLQTPPTMYLNNEWLRRMPSYELVDKKPRRRKNTLGTPSA